MKFLTAKEQLDIIKKGAEEIIPEKELVTKLERSRKDCGISHAETETGFERRRPFC